METNFQNSPTVSLYRVPTGVSPCRTRDYYILSKGFTQARHKPEAGQRELETWAEEHCRSKLSAVIMGALWSGVDSGRIAFRGPYIELRNQRCVWKEDIYIGGHMVVQVREGCTCFACSTERSW